MDPKTTHRLALWAPCPNLRSIGSLGREDLIRVVLLLLGRISNYLELDFLLRGNMSSLPVDPLARCTDDIQPIVDWLLHRAMDLSQTSFGNVQLMSWTAGYLEITAQLGFDEQFLKFFERVRIEVGSACARALRNREAIVIEDIMADDEFSPCRQVVSQAGIRAVQSTPIISSSGAVLEVMSTHFAAFHWPTSIELRELQHTAQIAANAFIRVGASRHSLHERIKSSPMLIDQSWKHIAQADRLLVLSGGACAQAAMLDLNLS
jgi:GAF domain-containing protein